ncbi:MAG TPA: ROK family glucokinase [Bacillota bacterium]|nr:ROK family glucokinase [Bacillota bacterium]
MSESIIGVDVGGTTIKIGFLSENGDILAKCEIPTNKTNNGSAILTDMWKTISDEMYHLDIKKDDIIGIGVGVPGFVNSEKGIVDEAVNIGWKNVKIRDELRSLSDLPVCVANDANTAVLGENWLGAGNQAKNVLAITLGTGVGGGIIVNGELVNGENGTAGEIGHSTVKINGLPCNCGKKGCLETIASATGIVKQAEVAINNNPSSELATYYNEHGDISAKDVFDMAKNGNKLCKEIIHYTMDILGFSLANIATVLNPSKILIGGGVSKAGDILIEGLKDSFQNYALPRTNDVCTIKLAELGNDAGMTGAAFLVKQQIRHVVF